MVAACLAITGFMPRVVRDVPMALEWRMGTLVLAR